MNLKPQKRMAASILKCGENRVYFDPYLIEDIAMAITREDIRNLVKEGAIQKRYKKGIVKPEKIYVTRGKRKVLEEGLEKEKVLRALGHLRKRLG